MLGHFQEKKSEKFFQKFSKTILLSLNLYLTVTYVDTDTVTRNCPYTLDQDLDFRFFEHRFHSNVLKTCLKHSLEEIGSEMIVYPEKRMDYI